MDHGNFTASVGQEQEKQADADFDQYVEEDGKKYRLPYRIIRKAVFSNVSRKELIDIPHAARLQYRLMLLDPILKARVDFARGRIIVLYNPKTAKNNKEKMNLDDLLEVLSAQGIHPEKSSIEDTDYDYYHDFYSYAYQPSRIREHPPYAYTDEEWKGMKQEWEANMKEGERKKLEKFHAYQNQYLIEHPDMAGKIVEGWKPPQGPQNKSLIKKLLGTKKKGSKDDKGFWFHGV